MKIDVTPVMFDLDGNALQEITKEGSAPSNITLRHVISRSLSKPAQDLGADELVKRGTLARQVMKAASSIDLSAEDVTLVKKCVVAFGWGPIVVADAFELIDPKPKLVEKSAS